MLPPLASQQQILPDVTNALAPVAAAQSDNPLATMIAMNALGGGDGVLNALALSRMMPAGSARELPINNPLGGLAGAAPAKGLAQQPSGGGGGYREAISAIESGSRAGNYQAVGPRTRKGDRAYGRYQVMDFNIGPWTQQVLGRAYTPQEFLADPAAQDQVFDAIFGGYVRKYGSPQDAASVWFSGRPLRGNTSSDGWTSVPEYVQRFTAGLR